MKSLLFLIVLLCFGSCKKSNYFDFPEGKYELIDYDVENICDETSFGFNTTTFVSKKELISNVLEFDGQKNITYKSNNGIEKFKVLDCNIVNKETYFQNNGNYATKKYQIILKNKLKKFNFNYFPINDSILIGVFWEKNQSYFTSDKPNVINYTCGDPFNIFYDEFHMPVTPQQSFPVTDLFGVFKKIHD